MSDLGLPFNPVIDAPFSGGLKSLPAPRLERERHVSMEQAAKDFESVLLNKLLDGMKETVGDGGLFNSPIGKQVQGLFYYYLAQDIASKGGFGLWKDIQRSLEAQTQYRDKASIARAREVKP